MKLYSNIGNSKNAYVVFKNQSAEVLDIIVSKLDGIEADENHVLRVDKTTKENDSDDKTDKKKKDDSSSQHTIQGEFSRKKSVFVGNLPITATESSLRNVFSS